jgi:hypothetical protein
MKAQIDRGDPEGRGILSGGLQVMIRSDVGAMLSKFCYRTQPGKHLLFASISHFDSDESWPVS